MDKKGIFIYLAVALGLSWLLVPALLYVGLIVYEQSNLLNYLIFMLLMWVPALAALVASKWSPRDGMKPAVWPLPMGGVAALAIGVPCVFAIIHVITWLFGWTEIQWSVSAMVTRIEGMMQQPLTPEVAAMAPMVALCGGFVLSVLFGATLFAALALGSELGWRGYLQPRLMPLGRIPAYLLTGLAWFLWMLPLIGGYYLMTGSRQDLWNTVPRLFAMVLLLSILLGEVRTRSAHTGLAAVALGCFFGQASDSIWVYLFPMSAIPWTGPYGVVAIVVWFVIAVPPLLLGARPALMQDEASKE
jgi:membrane protease YdiL (CAAX protease family)